MQLAAVRLMGGDGYGVEIEEGSLTGYVEIVGGRHNSCLLSTSVRKPNGQHSEALTFPNVLSKKALCANNMNGAIAQRRGDEQRVSWSLVSVQQRRCSVLHHDHGLVLYPGCSTLVWNH